MIILAFVFLVANSTPIVEPMQGDSDIVTEMLQMLEADIDHMERESHERLFSGLQEFAEFLNPEQASNTQPQLQDLPNVGPVVNFIAGFASGYSGVNIPDLEDVFKDCKAAPKAFWAALKKAEQAWKNSDKSAILKDLLAAAVDTYKAVQSCCRYIPDVKQYCDSIEMAGVKLVARIVIAISPRSLQKLEEFVLLGSAIYNVYNAFEAMYNKGDISYYKLGSIVGTLIYEINKPRPFFSPYCETVVSKAVMGLPSNASATKALMRLYNAGALNACFLAAIY